MVGIGRLGEMGPQRPPPRGSLLKSFCVGAAGSMIGAASAHPLDLLKVRLQVQGETGPRTRSWASEVGAQGRKGMLQMARSVWKTDGLQGFLSGVSASVREAISSD